MSEKREVGHDTDRADVWMHRALLGVVVFFALWALALAGYVVLT